LGGALALGGLALAGVGGVAGLQMLRRFDQWAVNALTRPPRATLRMDPTDFGLPYEDVAFKSADGVDLRGWLIRAADMPQEATATIIIGHGYSGNKDANLGYAAFLRNGGYNSLLFDFRAHGLSGGEQTSIGFIENEDVRGAIDYLAARGLKRLGYMGFSLGAAIGIVSAALYPEIRGLIAGSGFARLGSPISVILQREYRRPAWLARLAGEYGERLLARELGFDWREAHPVALIGRISPRPVLITHSIDDQLIPVSDAYALYAAAGEPKQLWVEHAGPHDPGLFATFHEEYKRRVLAFWDSIDWGG
jgi:pimeloyl-ACP methyl ester carboxylesterase